MAIASVTQSPATTPCCCAGTPMSSMPSRSPRYAMKALPAPNLPGVDMSRAPYHVLEDATSPPLHYAEIEMSDDDHIPAGRLKRLSRLAYLTARTTGDLLAAQARRRLSGESASNEDLKKAGERILGTLGELKGAALKLGQALAMDPDALPEEARKV